MRFLFLLLVVVAARSFQLCHPGGNKEYLSVRTTQVIKGIFILFVFLSHARSYTSFPNAGDQGVIYFLNCLGQLMVTLFLFYSGYGVMESVKRKGASYIRSFPKNRIGKTFFDFLLALALFMVLNMLLGQHYEKRVILLSLIGWESIGNSAWYMFAIFTLYLITFLCFSVSREKHKFLGTILVTLCSLAYVYVMSYYKDDYWSNTYLCYVAGMWYSLGRESVEEWFERKPAVYGAAVFGTLFSYLALYHSRGTRLMAYNLVSVLFCLLVVLATWKLEVSESYSAKLLEWCGKNLFWIYILQRIPMLLLKRMGLCEKNVTVFLFASLVFTVLMSYGMNRLSGYLKKKIWR